MTPPIWVTELADRFWAAAGPPPPAPRDLTAAATTAVPLAVVPVPGLTLAAVRGWLARVGVAVPLDEPDRPLRGCLVARGGVGFAFVDADDPVADRRFSVAHELAHFLRDYDAVRRAAAARVGPEVLDVLDGKRPATATERLHAVLRAVPVTAHAHLMRRDDDGRPRTPAEQAAEAAADRLAFELLAPAERFADDRDEVAVRRRLEAEFGLPPGPAAAYASILVPRPPTEPFIERLTKSG